VAADYDGPPLVSFTADVAKGLGLSATTVSVNVLGREVGDDRQPAQGQLAKFSR
jgi:predicted lysophospholipase L1 biosynthesis ABC-type transport system permease subunit